MSIYTSKERLELRMTKKVVAELSKDNGVVNENVPEECCETADALVLSKIYQFYTVNPNFTARGIQLLEHAATLYATALLNLRDPGFARTYVDASKSPQYMQAEKIMCEIQLDSRCLYDNANQPFIGAGVVSPTLAQLACVPRLFGDDYHGDL